MSWTLFVSTFSLIFLAELPDKTAFAAFLLGSRGSPWATFVGVALAFAFQSAVAVAFGGLLGNLPPKWVHLGAGLIFLVFAALSLRKEKDETPELHSSVIEEVLPSVGQRERFARTAWNSFVMIFIAEWGDLTQLSTASISARYQMPATVFTASTLALWSVSAIAIFAGNRAGKLISPAKIKRASGVAFAAVGIYFLIQWFNAA